MTSTAARCRAAAGLVLAALLLVSAPSPAAAQSGLEIDADTLAEIDPNLKEIFEVNLRSPPSPLLMLPQPVPHGPEQHAEESHLRCPVVDMPPPSPSKRTIPNY